LELLVAALVAFANPFLPLIGLLHSVLTLIYSIVHNYGWSLLILAALVKIVLWYPNTMQFKSMLKMQQLSPQLKALQQRYKNDKEKLNEATMALYKETGVNPLAGCAPLLLQMPVLISLYWAIISDKSHFATQGWLWIGTPFAIHSPYHILAASLATTDYILLLGYMASMYFSVRFTSPATDPAQAQQQKIMAFVSPAMIGYLSFKYRWPSALIIYWMSYNLFTMAQQYYLIRKYRSNPGGIGPHPEAAVALPATGTNGRPKGTPANAPAGAAASSGGSRAARRRRSSRR